MTDVAGWFGLPGNSEFAAFVLSLVSLVIAIVAILTSWKTQKRIVEIEEAREKDRLNDMLKADLIARLVRDGTDRYNRLIIDNRGPAEAREISIQVNDRPLSEFPAFMSNQPEIRRVGPYSSFHYLMAFSAGLDPRVYSPEITINWTDDSGGPGTYQTILTY